MTKGQTVWGGKVSVFDGPDKPYNVLAPPPPAFKFWARYAGNGFVFDPLPTTDLHLVADDAGPASWASRAGSYSAIAEGTPTTGLETPLDPAGNFNGTTHRQAVNFDALSYYYLPYDPAHFLTASSTTTYDILFFTGDFVSNEILISQFTPTGYNFYVAIFTIFSTPYIEVRVQHTINDAVVQYQCSRFAAYRLKMTYDGASKTLTLALNGKDIGNSVGEGVPLSGGTDDLIVGAATAGFNLGTSKLIEIQRSQEIVSTASWATACYKFWGLQDVKGTSPLVFSCATKSALTVNGSIWQFGENWARMNNYGVLPENYTSNVLQNSTFTEAFGTGYSIAGASVSYVPDANCNVNVGGNGLNVVNDLAANEYGVYWIYPFLGGLTPCWLSFEWAALDVGANAYWQVYNFATGKYYDQAASGWTPAITYNVAPYLGAGKKTHKAIFANDITGGSLLFLVCNGREANTKSLSFYHVQLMPGFDYAAAPFVYESVAGGNFKSYDFIQYPATPAIDYTKGKLTGEITALSNSSEPSSNTRVYWAGFGGMAGSVAGTSNFTLSDGAHTATITVPYISGQTLSFAQEWGGTTMTNKELTSGQTATATFTSPIDSGPFVVGGDGSANYQSGFYTKNLKIK